MSLLKEPCLVKSDRSVEHDNSLLLKWASISQGLNIGLLCVAVLAVSLFGICYWALGRVVEEEKDKVSFHFTRLMGDIREHETFLARIAQKSDDATQKKDQDVVPLQRRLLTRESGLEIYEGREFSFAMPFILATGRELDEGGSWGPFSLGVLLANFYGSFWSISPYPAPQLLVFDLNGDTNLAVPAIDTSATHDGPRDTYPELAARILARLHERPPGSDDLRVHWARADHYRGQARELLGYVGVELPAPLWWQGETRRSIVAASLLDLGRINDFEQLMERPAFASFSLASPNGEILVGTAPPADLVDGLNLSRQGILIQLRSQPESGWTAVYRIDYASFFRQAQWLLAGLLLLLPGFLLAGWLGLRWYARRVVRPVHRAHRQLVESDTFSRTLIQTAPVALVVLSHDGRKLVTCNHLAAQWLGDEADILALTAGWNLFESHGQVPGGICIQVGGRYLQAAFAATRYAGVEAVLCVFNDITVHCEAEEALASAKRAADAASQAKTLFLASMSHEIRTPLYGVLGTLELLGLTDLDSRQRAYLRTIQNSSSTLLQLISDVLDVSKIEAGQMALNPAAFNPAELVEEVLRNYAASAAAKGLQFYACIDAGVPAQLLGDAARIRQILNNLVSNALKFTDIGRVVLRLKLLARENGRANLQWQVADTGAGIAEEQQGRLFEAFYQVPGVHHTSGTGLGLSISWRLAEMMGGSLRVVSEVGLGSSFSLLLELPEGGRQGLAFHPACLRPGPVYVHSPVRELADSVAAWLECWGCNVLGGEPSSDGYGGAVLLELLPAAEPRAWSGPRVCATADAPTQPELREDGWYVSLYSLTGIALALALAQGSELPAPARAAANIRSEGLGLHVLVAEDNPINQTLLCEQLEELGCSVSLASDGREALRLFDDRHFDVLLSDVNMPNMNGYELTQALRGRGETLPIIGVTANALREEGERCRAVGMDAWLVKPISLRTLNDLLGELVGKPGLVAPQESSEPAMAEEPLQVPERMRSLFLETMGKDLAATREAAGRGDAEALRQGVHRMAGALAVARAQALVMACREVEEGLMEGRLGCTASETAQVLGRIEQALERLREAG
ncbi:MULTISPECIES: hybrid sensor histidine kinase/response regulator [unclassified Pseudomonas]|uniref:hybrid sensor histidine kinase/response regulator n=1 Tax=unclassified Pseudomonas TaxID=196821 RepID=UPI001CE0D0D4|nr:MULTISPECIES: hybrid sensor histidine kinase/response regulator [unclassified Pseudomonas]